MNKSFDLTGVLLVLTGAICSSTKAVLVKLAYPYGIDALSLLVVRMAMVFPFFVLLAIFSKSPVHVERRPRDYWFLIPIGLLGYYLASFLDFYGLQIVPASVERLILFSYPTLVVILSWIFLREKTNIYQLIALFLTYAGILLVLNGDVSLPDRTLLWKGGSIIFLSALSYALYLVGSSKMIPKFGVIRFTSLVLSVAGLGVFTHAGIVQLEGLLSYEWPVYGYIGLIAVIATIIPVFLISEGIRRIGPSNTAIIGSVGPIATIFLAYIFLDERLTFIQIVGTVVVLAGVMMVSLQKSRKKEREIGKG
ncbi:MAG: DMT family transporter [Bacteroidota bacterium]